MVFSEKGKHTELSEQKLGEYKIMRENERIFLTKDMVGRKD